MRAFLATGLLLVLSSTCALAQAPTFGATTPTSLPTVIGSTFFSSAELTFSGSVDYTGPATTLTGKTVVNGDLRLGTASSVTVGAGGSLYVYGNVFAAAGALKVLPGGHLYFYGNQWVGNATASVTGGGVVHFIGPRPAPGATADGQVRPNAPDGLAGGSVTQQVDGSGATWAVDVEHRTAAGVQLSDLNNDGSSDLATSGTLTLGTNAPLQLGNGNLVLDQRPTGATGTIAGYSEQRYVTTAGQGRVKVLGLPDGASFTFPVGSSPTGDYTPARLTNRSGGAVALSAGVSATAGSPAGNAAGRYWELSSDAPATVDVTLQHNLATGDAGYNNSQAAIAGNASGVWMPAGPASAGTTSGTLTTGSPISGASELFQATLRLTSAATQYTKETVAPLPVTLVDFTAARATDGQVVLRWVTASELNNAGFQVEASSDGLAWLARGAFVPGSGTTTTQHRYTWQEINPAATYYRLAQRDLSGKLTYAPTRYVAALGVPAGLSLYPNPASGLVHLSGADLTKPVDLYNALGQLAAHFEGTADLALTGLPAGMYVVRQGSQALRLVVR